jgi:hypothetical protein
MDLATSPRFSPHESVSVYARDGADGVVFIPICCVQDTKITESICLPDFLQQEDVHAPV